MLTDVKEQLEETHMTTMLELLCEYGHAEKLKIILDKVTD